MSEPVLKQRQTIDLDDFERRLRQASDPAHGGHRDDALAELARLVGEPYDPFQDVFAQEARAGHGAGAPTHDLHDAHAYNAQPEHVGQHAYHDAPARGRAEAAHAGEAPRLFGDFAAIEAGLRSREQAQDFDHQQAQAFDHQQAQALNHQSVTYADPYYPPAGQPQLAQDGEWTGHAAPLAAEGRGAPTRRPMAMMAAAIAIGVAGIGGAYALKGRVSSSPREIKTIMADATPTKVQPPPDAAADTSGDAGAFGRSGQVTPGKLISREEQPVDIAQAVHDNVARAAQITTATDASSVPVPASPGQVLSPTQGRAGSRRSDPIADQVQGFGLAEMPAPKRVKVVSVSPNGKILTPDRALTDTAPVDTAPVKASDHPAPVAKASKVAKPVAAKTTSRVGARADGKPVALDGAAADAAQPADDAPAKPTRRAKPQRVASAETSETAAADAGEQPAAVEGGGGYAVQLAAPGSESDAKAASSRLSTKFSAALGGRRLGFRKADANGKSVYRVRVSSLSRADAVSLCEKLKADGGSCFVAKN